jgi:hypothetical protein
MCQARLKKNREIRARKRLARTGYGLLKNRSKDELAEGYRGHRLFDRVVNAIVSGAVPYKYCLSLDDVDALIQEKNNTIGHE